MEVAVDVRIRIERQPASADQPVGPPGRHLRRSAECPPVLAECLDIGNRVGLVGLPQALEPLVTCLGIRWRGRDNLRQRVDGPG